MAENTRKLNSLFAPIIVLVCIGLVASFLLAGVYQITEPIITAREKEMMSKSLAAVLPKASSFTKLDNAELVDYVSEVYQADNGAGIVCTTNCKSKQGGEIKMMVGIDSFGSINGISVISHGETAGLGDKALAQDYLSKYYGLSDVDAVSSVDVYSGVTKTSNAVKESCQVALKEFELISKNSNPIGEITEEQAIVNACNTLFPNVDNFSKIGVELKENVIGVYQAAGNSGYVVYVKSPQNSAVTAAVGITPGTEATQIIPIKTNGGAALSADESTAMINAALAQYQAIK